MARLFTRERFGAPQILAGLLLLMFVGECCWLIAHQPLSEISPEESARVQQGLAQWHGKNIAGTAAVPANSLDELGMQHYALYHPHSPLWYLIESALIALFRVPSNSVLWIWLTRVPYMLCGTLLGASLWYVSRRLYGNAGGYTALALYCFSPSVIRSSALWFAQPNITATWATFGAVFTAIAVSHTLYAPREVVLWNWRRIVLLGVSLALAVGSEFSLAIIILPMLLVFMLYLAPARRGPALVILVAACVIALLLLLSAYFFHAGLLVQGLKSSARLNASGAAFRMRGAYVQLLRELTGSGPVLALLVPAALVTYAAWRRARYFGNTAPLLVAMLFCALRVSSPHEPDSVFSLIAAAFLFVFVAGIAADLLETKAREWGIAGLVGLLGANAVWNLIGLAGIAN